MFCEVDWDPSQTSIYVFSHSDALPPHSRGLFGPLLVSGEVGSRWRLEDQAGWLMCHTCWCTSHVEQATVTAVRLGLSESYADSSRWHQEYDELVAKGSKVMLSR